MKPAVAPAPLEVLRRPASISAGDHAKLLEQFERLIRASGVRTPAAAQLKAAIDGATREDWSSSDVALSELAQRAQMLYGLYVQLDYPLTGSVVAIGRVVRSDGSRTRAEVRIERAREKRSYFQVSSETITALLEKLELQTLPSTIPAAVVEVTPSPPVVVAPAVVVPPPASNPVSAPVDAPRQRIAAFGVAGAGLVSAGTGAGLLIAASLTRAALHIDRNGNVGVPFTSEAAAQARGAETMFTAGAIVLSVGAAALIGALILYLTAPAYSTAPEAGVFSLRPGAFAGLDPETP